MGGRPNTRLSPRCFWARVEPRPRAPTPAHLFTSWVARGRGGSLFDLRSPPVVLPQTVVLHKTCSHFERVVSHFVVTIRLQRIMARKCSLGLVRRWDAAGANVNFQTKGKYTPLHEAAREGNVGMCELLLDGGASAALRELAGGTALHLAAEAGHTELVKKLLAIGMDRDATRLDGHTPLSLAGQAGQQAVLELLVDKGAAWS